MPTTCSSESKTVPGAGCRDSLRTHSQYLWLGGGVAATLPVGRSTLESHMKQLTIKAFHVLTIAATLLALALPALAQTDLGCQTMVAPNDAGQPRPVFTDYNPAEGSNERCILDKMTWTTGIMTGCDVNLFCKDALLTRQEMAVYLLNGLYPSTPTEPQAPFPSAVGIFDDVPADYPLACFIEKLRSTGITAGCSSTMYCPGSAVSRAQMAVFVVKARHFYDVPAFVPPDCQGTIFQDVTCASGYDKWIEQAYRDGITAGCDADPPLFCPSSSVTRWQMMVFLRKTFFSGPCE